MWWYYYDRNFKTIPFDHCRYRKILGKIFRKYYEKVLKNLDNPSELLTSDFIYEFDDELNRHLRLLEVTEEEELVNMTVESLKALTARRAKLTHKT